MTTEDDFEEFNDEFDELNADSDDNTDETANELDVAAIEISADSGETTVDESEQSSEFVIVDNQITDYLDVVSDEPAPALFALPQTGEARVDDAIARLGDLENLPVNDHVEIFEDVHRRLHETLADLASS